MPTQKQLIKATNLLCEFVDKHLPPGWEIRLCMSHSESYFSLFSPSGDEIDSDAADHNISALSDMCQTATELHAEMNDQIEVRN